MGKKGNWFKTFFYGRILSTTVNMQKDVINYGVDDSFPFDNMVKISNSGIANRAAAKLSSYIKANGWIVDAAADETVINENQNRDELLSDVSLNFAWFGGCALMIRRNTKGEIKSVETIYFPGVRKKEDGSFTYNPNAGTDSFKQDETQDFPKFKGQVDKEGMALHIATYGNKGEILYFFKRAIQNVHYPVPDYYAGIEDIETSSELQLLDLEAVIHGFVPSGLLVTGEYDDEEKDEDKKTAADLMAEEIEKFTGSKKDKKGLSRRRALLWIQAKAGDQAPSLETYDAKSIIDASNAKRDQIERTVARLFHLHPVLLGFADAAILGNMQAIANAAFETIKDVDDVQTLIEANFKKIWPTIVWKINKFNVIQYIPPEIFATLTSNEKRDMIGLKPTTDDPIN